MPQPDLSKPQRQAWPGLVVMYFQNLRNWVNAFIVLIIPTITGNNQSAYYFYLGGGLLLVILAFFAYLQFKNFYFRVLNNKFIINSGVLKRDEMSVPFDRIQAVNIKQNIVQQLLNVVALEVETAGSKTKEVVIPALSRAYAEDLKSFLLKEKEELTAHAEPESESVSAKPESVAKQGRLLLSLSIADLIKVGLTENHLRTGFIAIAIVWNYINQYSELLEEDFEQVTKQAETVINTILLLVPLAVIGFVLISVLLSLIRIVLRYFNLQAFLSNTSLVVQAGLFKKQENVVPANKIQYISWKTNPLRKLIGYQSLAIYQAGSEEVNRKQSVQIPGCREREISQINEAFFPELIAAEPLQIIKPNAFYRYRLGLFLALLPTVSLFFVAAFAEIWFAGLALVYFVFSLLYIHKYYQTMQFELYAENIVLKRGYVFPETILLKNYKIQGVEISQSIFQRRRGLVSLSLFTAAGDLSIPFINEGIAYSLANKILYQVEKNKLAWM